MQIIHENVDEKSSLRNQVREPGLVGKGTDDRSEDEL